MGLSLSDYVDKDFQFTSKWKVRFIIAPALLGWNVLNAYCSSASLPDWTINDMSASLGSHEYFQPANISYGGEMTFEFIDTVNADIMKIIEIWRNVMHLTEVGTSVHRLLKTGLIRVTMLDNNGDNYGSFYLTDVYLKGVSMGQLTSETGTLFRPTLTFKYNEFVWLPI